MSVPKDFQMPQICWNLAERESETNSFIWFLYFLQEVFADIWEVWWYWSQITAYFYALATPQVQQVITVVDKVGGIEKLIQQSDIEGGPAIKLNLSLDTPIIIMPRNSESREWVVTSVSFISTRMLLSVGTGLPKRLRQKYSFSCGLDFLWSLTRAVL